MAGTCLVRVAARAICLDHVVGVPAHHNQRARVYERPLSAAEAQNAVSAWLAQPAAGTLEPGERHWAILQRLMKDGQATGALVMDAALAALAIEHGATLYTTDRDFARFRELRWTNPLEPTRR